MLPVLAPAGIPIPDSPSWLLLLRCHPESLSFSPIPLQPEFSFPGGSLPNRSPSSPLRTPGGGGDPSRTKGCLTQPLWSRIPAFPVGIAKAALPAGSIPAHSAARHGDIPAAPRPRSRHPAELPAPPSLLSSSFSRPRPAPGAVEPPRRRGRGCALTFWSMTPSRSGPKSCHQRWE